MNNDDFISTIVDMLRSALPEDIHAESHTVRKNNNTILTGIRMSKKGSNIAPIIYMEEFYQRYLNGAELSEILDQILTIYHENNEAENYDISYFTDFDKVRDRVVFRIVNREKNEELLKTVPFTNILDLAMVFCVIVNEAPGGIASITITNEHLKVWGIGKAELQECAKKNTPHLFPWALTDMQSMLSSILARDADADVTDATDSLEKMYVLTNNAKWNGAACLCYPGLLKKCAAQLKSSFYIIPSSIGELILLPSTKDNLRERLDQMVREVNESCVAVDEVLSDHVYFYDKTQGMILPEQAAA